jgi:hypothetical protein
MEGLRRRLLALEFDALSIDTLFAAWEPSTIKNYQSSWSSWSVFCASTGADSFVVNELALAVHLGKLTRERGIGQGTVEGTAAAVRSTWATLYDPSFVLKKVGVAAGKLNRPKTKKHQVIFDLSYVWHLFDESENGLPFTTSVYNQFQLTQRTICLVKGITGWRAADLAGIWLPTSLRWTATGVFVQNYDTKSRQKVWSPPVFIPALAPEYNSVSAYFHLKMLSDRLL